MNNRKNKSAPVTIIFVLLLILLLVIFTLQNKDTLNLNVLFWKIEAVPFVLALVISFIVGFLMSFIYFYPKLWKLNSEIKELNRRLSKLVPERRTEIIDEDFEITGGAEEDIS